MSGAAPVHTHYCGLSRILFLLSSHLPFVRIHRLNVILSAYLLSVLLYTGFVLRGEPNFPENIFAMCCSDMRWNFLDTRPRTFVPCFRVPLWRSWNIPPTTLTWQQWPATLFSPIPGTPSGTRIFIRADDIAEVINNLKAGPYNISSTIITSGESHGRHYKLFLANRFPLLNCILETEQGCSGVQGRWPFGSIKLQPEFINMHFLKC